MAFRIVVLLMLLSHSLSAQGVPTGVLGPYPQLTLMRERAITALDLGVTSFTTGLATGENALALLSSTDHTLLLVDTAGKILATRRFSSEVPPLGRIGAMQDTLWVITAGLVGAFHLLDARLRTTRTIEGPSTRLQATQSLAGYNLPMGIIRTPLPGGHGLASVTAPHSDADPSRPPRTVLAAGPQGGAATRLLATTPGSCALTRGGPTVPFCGAAMSSISFNGRFVATMVPRQQLDSAGAVITLMGSRGDTVYSRFLPLRAMPIPTAIWDSVLAVPRLASLRDVPRTALPQVHPSVTAFLVTSDGSIMLEVRDGDDAPWLVLAPDGTLRGSVPPAIVRTRGGARPMDLIGDRLWVLDGGIDTPVRVIRTRIVMEG